MRKELIRGAPLGGRRGKGQKLEMLSILWTTLGVVIRGEEKSVDLFGQFSIGGGAGWGLESNFGRILTKFSA